MDKLIIIFLIIFGLLMTIIGIVDYKYPNLSWEYSLSRILHVKDVSSISIQLNDD